MRNLIRHNRDSRIDFFRGLALWSIFVDHLNKSWLRLVTLKQLAFCDSAELFVLLAGISAGIVYGPIVKRQGAFSAGRKVFRRAVVLYRTHLIVFMLFAAEAALLATHFNRPGFLTLFYFDPLATHPYHSILQAVTLRWQPQYLDILPLYVILLLIFCLVLPLLRTPKLLLSLSILLYAASRGLHLAMPTWQHPWYFNPFAWQLLFFIGVVSRSWLTSDKHWRGWDIVAAGVALFGLFESHARQLAHHVPYRFLVDVDAVDKTGLHPLRLTSILALSWLCWRYVPASANWLRRFWAKPFILMGQHSLPVFCAGLFVALFGQFLMFQDAGLISQIVVQGLGTAALVLVAALYAWDHKTVRAAPQIIHLPEMQNEPERVMLTA